MYSLIKELISEFLNFIPWEMYTFIFLIPMFVSIKLKMNFIKQYSIYLLIISSFLLGLLRINDDKPFIPSFSFESIFLDKTDQYLFEDTQKYFINQSYLSFGIIENNNLLFNSETIDMLYSESGRVWPPSTYLVSIKNISEFIEHKAECLDGNKTKVQLFLNNQKYEYFLCLN